jgi:hypothetical protein
MDAKKLSLLRLMDSLADPRVFITPDAVALTEEERTYVQTKKSRLRLSGAGFEKLMELQHELAIEGSGDEL